MVIPQCDEIVRGLFDLRDHEPIPVHRHSTDTYLHLVDTPLDQIVIYASAVNPIDVSWFAAQGIVCASSASLQLMTRSGPRMSMTLPQGASARPVAPLAIAVKSGRCRGLCGGLRWTRDQRNPDRAREN